MLNLKKLEKCVLLSLLIYLKLKKYDFNFLTFFYYFDGLFLICFTYSIKTNVQNKMKVFMFTFQGERWFLTALIFLRSEFVLKRIPFGIRFN